MPPPAQDANAALDFAAIETKLSSARTKLILDKPFLGALVLRLPLIRANPDWCETTATDAKGFYYNAAYINDLSLSQAQFMLAHEALHCALSHFARRQNRIKWRWDLACDFAINPILVDEGLAPPPNAVILREYSGMTAEEIYPLLDDKDEDDKTLDEHLYDDDNESSGSSNAMPKPQDADPDPDSPGQSGGRPEEGEADNGASRPPPLVREEQENLSVQWTQRLAGAAQQAMQSGKLGGGFARMVDHMLQPQLPWRMLLARYMTASARDDFNYARPSRREGAAIFPSLRSNQIEAVVVVDTSGSITKAEMDEFLSEVDAIKGQVRAKVSLIACDTELSDGSPWVFEAWEAIELPDKIGGGGGTDFRPPFEWLADTGRHADLLVYFTDAEGRFPKHEPSYPVIWLVKGRAKVPWGTRIQLN